MSKELTKELKYKKDDISRVDEFLSQTYPQYSKNSWKKIILEKGILVNGKAIKKGNLLNKNDTIKILNFPSLNIKLRGKNLNIIQKYSDKEIVIYDKPRGVPTHPNDEKDDSTLLNHFIFEFPQCLDVGEGGLRSGLIHRLDNDTSGLIIVAKTNLAYNYFRKEFDNKNIYKFYLAIVAGNIPKSGVIKVPIDHDPKSKKRMICNSKCKLKAKTRFRKIYFNGKYSFILVRTFTGRMHQVRVHLKHIGYPLIGDPIYNNKNQINSKVKGHLLHSYILRFGHPTIKDKLIKIKSPIPEYFYEIMGINRNQQ